MAETVRVPLRFSDFDTNKHVNNVAYFALMETARIEFLLRLREQGELGRLIVAHAEVDYLREITMRNAYADIELSVARIGRSSLTVHHEIHDETRLAAQGNAVLVGIAADGTSRALTDEERHTLGRHASG